MQSNLMSDLQRLIDFLWWLSVYCMLFAQVTAGGDCFLIDDNYDHFVSAGNQPRWSELPVVFHTRPWPTWPLFSPFAHLQQRCNRSADRSFPPGMMKGIWNWRILVLFPLTIPSANRGVSSWRVKYGWIEGRSRPPGGMSWTMVDN